ncbi:hypothetical protein NHX12_029197 [Muraenolepis orangiensis]|uniref:Uncharacterized protein n=1 Tax=Muraenolepis orangiensis TaxID=630683 RepID=A0A9Q0EHD7_9TELE|nr:hypothetical protein NHX12_029197 [Muraenolepis orangiensis]
MKPHEEQEPEKNSLERGRAAVLLLSSRRFTPKRKPKRHDMRKSEGEAKTLTEHTEASGQVDQFSGPVCRTSGQSSGCLVSPQDVWSVLRTAWWAGRLVSPQDMVCAGRLISPQDVVCAGRLVSPQDVVCAGRLISPQDVVCAGRLISPQDVVCAGRLISPQDMVCAGRLVSPQDVVCAGRLISP